MKKAIGFYPSAGIDTAGPQVVSHAGAVLLTETIAVVGLDTALSGALARWRPRLAVHDPAKVVLDLAVGPLCPTGPRGHAVRLALTGGWRPSSVGREFAAVESGQTARVARSPMLRRGNDGVDRLLRPRQ